LLLTNEGVGLLLKDVAGAVLNEGLNVLVAGAGVGVLKKSNVELLAVVVGAGVLKKLLFAELVEGVVSKSKRSVTWAAGFAVVAGALLLPSKLGALGRAFVVVPEETEPERAEVEEVDEVLPDAAALLLR
jgi:hypothetical protein